jgi:hypothetical protein
LVGSKAGLLLGVWPWGILHRNGRPAIYFLEPNGKSKLMQTVLFAPEALLFSVSFQQSWGSKMAAKCKIPLAGASRHVIYWNIFPAISSI